MAKTGQDQHLKLRNQSQILFLKVFFLTRNIARPPGKYSAWQKFFRSPRQSFFFDLPSFSKLGTESCSPQQEREDWCCVYILHASKYEYETALKNTGYQQTKLISSEKEQRKQKRICNRNIFCFNPPFSRNVTTSVAKRFLNLLDIHFPKSNKLHKILNRNRKLKRGVDTTLSKNVWEVKDKYKEMSSLKWSIVKSVPGYSNIIKKCLLCLYEKLEIVN